jgi:hypothetical protein
MNGIGDIAGRRNIDRDFGDVEDAAGQQRALFELFDGPGCRRFYKVSIQMVLMHAGQPALAKGVKPSCWDNQSREVKGALEAAKFAGFSQPRRVASTILDVVRFSTTDRYCSN